ncbi:hypothetical protein LTR70_003961 [Exophiala xenobiotica]|uniref:Ubiquitin-like domain-containing protein n=1 Tax=Lithohypha guttulata TaxID=1690604 RepID=A0ABR0K9G9_9EURO|nr:hypothetical protein LTR24_005275 [Lithohypha guttulata]KAK5322114.1 hypothetical protein LTR70_003961 [Exophiala xenobiotica]
MAGVAASRNAYGRVEIGGYANAVLGNVHVNYQQANEDISTDPKKAKEEMENRYHSIDPALTGTCQWFLDHPLYKDWLNYDSAPDPCPLLWLRGKPGAGKSTIIKMAIDHAKSVGHAPGHSGLTRSVNSFFFNSRGAVLECKPEGLFRSTLHQLFEPQALELEFEPLTLFLRKLNLFSHGWKWTEGELRAMFRRTVKRPGLDLVLFVDALDECEEEHIRPLVDFLVQEIDQAHRAGSLLRICLSSRHYPNVSARSCHTIVAEQHNGTDINTYVETQMSTTRGDMASIISKITQESSGVFLWTALVVRRMQEAIEDGESTSTLLEILASTPLGLSEIFEALLSSINENEREEARSILLFVLYAKRPLTLAELTIAFAFRKPYPSLFAYLDSAEFIPDEQMSRLITKRIRGLVEVKISGSSIVQFIHGSVREYLLRTPGLLLSTATTQAQLKASADNKLAQSCFNFIRVPDCNDHSLIPYVSRNSSYLLLFYAQDYAFQHAREAEAYGMRQSYIAEVLGLNSPDPGKWASLPGSFYNKVPAETRLSSLSFCCKNRLLSVVEELHPSLGNNGVAISALCQPLCAAAAAGAGDIIRVLIAKGARVNDVDNFYGSALYASVAEGHLEVSALLLRSGSAVDARGTYGTALILASSKGDEAHVRLLLDHNATVQMTSDKYGNALLAAVSEGHIGIVRSLLHHGADPSPRCRYWGGRYARKETHPLEEASYWGHEDIVSVLLEVTASSRLSQSHFRDALSAAASVNNIKCIILIGAAARHKFGPSWSAAGHPAPKVISPIQPRKEIEIEVKGLSYRVFLIPMCSNLQCIDLKNAIQARTGLPPSDQYLVISRAPDKGGVRKIDDEEYLCDRGLTDRTRIEVLLHFRPSPCDQCSCNPALSFDRDAENLQSSPTASSSRLPVVGGRPESTRRTIVPGDHDPTPSSYRSVLNRVWRRIPIRSTR